MHYPLAMPALALMDQRACKELKEQNKMDRDEEDKRAGKGKWREKGVDYRKAWVGRLGERVMGVKALSVTSCTPYHKQASRREFN